MESLPATRRQGRLPDAPEIAEEIKRSSRRRISARRDPRDGGPRRNLRSGSYITTTPPENGYALAVMARRRGGRDAHQRADRAFRPRGVEFIR